MSDITQTAADAVLAAALSSAQETGTAMNIAVVDAGGIPLHDSTGAVIGAIGVSGSTVENDHTVASAGAAAQLQDVA
ncbi:heme-binding protein [Paenarthrobacter sp. NPDC058040]|uniref:heme-binding protein n=1 Tax=unclassified Paenarthrobacter TaxID=2634190 RepID=UPI0036DE0E44